MARITGHYINGIHETISMRRVVTLLEITCYNEP